MAFCFALSRSADALSAACCLLAVCLSALSAAAWASCLALSALSLSAFAPFRFWLASLSLSFASLAACLASGSESGVACTAVSAAWVAWVRRFCASAVGWSASAWVAGGDQCRGRDGRCDDLLFHAFSFVWIA